MGDSFWLETVIIFVCILLYLLYWFYRSMSHYCAYNNARNRNAQTASLPAPVTQITVPSTPPPNQMEHGMIFPGVLHMEAQLNPPPYTAVAFALPPSYDEAIKQSTEENVARPANSSTEENKY